MKRLPVVVISTFLFAVIVGCDGLLPDYPGPVEQVQGFLAAASADPQSPATMASYFHPNTDQLDLMADSTYWESTFFNASDGDYTIVNPVQGGEDADYPGSVTVTGNVTNTFSPTDGYPAVFVLLPRTADSLFPEYLIREITLETGDPPINKIVP